MIYKDIALHIYIYMYFVWPMAYCLKFRPQLAASTCKRPSLKCMHPMLVHVPTSLQSNSNAQEGIITRAI